MTDQNYIQRCIYLAQKALGNTYPNPMVGSIIVHNGKIIGEGFHHKAGEPHAEINAINSVQNPELIPESTIYVSLEPCAHFGKTPPCALKIKELGFKKVVIGAMDPHDKVNGKGKKIISDAGIEVVSGVLAEECFQLNKRFNTFHQKKRPYIILKWAESEDGFLDKNGKPIAIGNSLTKQWVHQVRSQEHAILVGTTTVLHDNPTLTTREVEGRNPIRIVIDRQLKLDANASIFNNEAETIILNEIKDEKQENLHYVKVEPNRFLENALEKLYELQIQSILIEGGRFTHQQFIDSGIWDEAFSIQNPNLKLIEGTPAPNLIHAEKLEEIAFEDNIIVHFKNSKN